MAPCVLTVLLVNVFCCVVSSLYFHIGDTEKKCFLEEIPEDTVIIGNFGTRLDENLMAPQDRGILVEAKDPDGELLLSQRCGSEGRFTFRSLKLGRHQICLQSSSSQRPLSAGGVLTLHLDIRAGERTNNYTEIAAKDKLTELQLRVRQLAEQVQQIQRQQDYQRLREKHFREVSHDTRTWIFWWPVARSLYVVAVIIWSTNSWSPGEGGYGEESEQELEAVEAEQDGAEEELQPQDEGLQQQVVNSQRGTRNQDEE